MALDLGVVGQTAAVRLIEVMLSSGRLPHALLFTGPPHSGKTTLMCGLAAYLNCPDADGRGPCRACPSCQRIAKGADFDVRTVDVAEGHGRVQIDQIREFENRVALTSLGGRFKIAIFPNAHLFSESAANALLKTLEQPPGHTLIMLAAPDVSSLLPTVASRCSRLRLYALPDKLLGELVRSRTGVDGEDLETALAHAFGRPGWALAMASDRRLLQRFDRRAKLMLSALEAGNDDARRMEVAATVATDGRSAAERRSAAIESLEWLELALAARRSGETASLIAWANDAALLREGLRRLRGNAMLRPAIEDVFLNIGRLQAT